MCDLRPGERARVVSIHVEGAMRRRLLDMGLIPGAMVRCVGKSPGGDPVAYEICGAVIAIRRQNSARICVQRWGEGESAWG